MINTANQTLILDCDGTCYPLPSNFRQIWQRSLQDTMAAWNVKPESFIQTHESLRHKHPGIMNTVLALCGGNMLRFYQFTDDCFGRIDYTFIQPNLALGARLRQMKGTTCLWSNNCRSHVQRVWNRLFPKEKPYIPTFTIETTYDGHWFHPKNAPDGFRRFCAIWDLEPAQSVMLDDTPEILDRAAQFGLKTRLVNRQKPLLVHLNELTRV